MVQRLNSLQQGKGAMESLPKQSSPLRRKLGSFFQELTRVHLGKQYTGGGASWACTVWDAHYWACSLQDHCLIRKDGRRALGSPPLGLWRLIWKIRASLGMFNLCHKDDGHKYFWASWLLSCLASSQRVQAPQKGHLKMCTSSLTWSTLDVFKLHHTEMWLCFPFLLSIFSWKISF